MYFGIKLKQATAIVIMVTFLLTNVSTSFAADTAAGKNGVINTASSVTSTKQSQENSKPETETLKADTTATDLEYSNPEYPELHLNTPVDVNIVQDWPYSYFQFTPAATGIYTITTDPYEGFGDRGYSNINVYNYNNHISGKLISWVSNSTIRESTKLDVALTKGDTYLIELISVNTRIQIKEFQKELSLDLFIDVNADKAEGSYGCFKFTPSSSGIYSIFTSLLEDNMNTYLELYSDPEMTNLIAFNDDLGGESSFSKIAISLTQGKTYYVKLCCNYSDKLKCRIKVSKEIPGINENSFIDADFPAGYYQVYKFVPAVTAKYKIYTRPYFYSGILNDTYLELYTDENLTNMIMADDDSGGDCFSKIEVDLRAGSTYYIKLKSNSGDSEGIHASLGVTRAPRLLDIYLNVPVDVKLAENERAVFRFTPSKSATYSISAKEYGSNEVEYGDGTLGVYTDENLTDCIEWMYTMFGDIQLDMNANTTYYIEFCGIDLNSAEARVTVKRLDDDQDGIRDSMETSGIPIGYDGKYITTVYLDPTKKDTDDDGLDDGVELIYLQNMNYDSDAGVWYYEAIDNPNSSIQGSFLRPEGITPSLSDIFDLEGSDIQAYQTSILECKMYLSDLEAYANKISECSGAYDGEDLEQVENYLSRINNTYNTFEDAVDVNAYSILASPDLNSILLAWVQSNTSYFYDTGIARANGDIEARVNLYHMILGSAVHKSVGVMFLAENPPPIGRYNKQIPNSTRTIRPDLVIDDGTTVEIYEIKPISYSRNLKDPAPYFIAKRQLDGYVKEYNENNTQAVRNLFPGWKPSWNPNGRIIQVLGRNEVVQLYTYADQPGMIYYEITSVKEPNYSYSVNPYTVLDENRRTVTVFAKDNNTGLVLGVVAIGGAFVLVVGTVAEDVFTAGAGVADDPVSFAAATKLIKEGYNLIKNANIPVPTY